MLLERRASPRAALNNLDAGLPLPPLLSTPTHTRTQLAALHACAACTLQQLLLFAMLPKHNRVATRPTAQVLIARGADWSWLHGRHAMCRECLLQWLMPHTLTHRQTGGACNKACGNTDLAWEP